MKFTLKIENLGPLKTGRIDIRPLTVLAGPNGTGKSFVTRSLYSVLNVVNKVNWRAFSPEHKGIMECSEIRTELLGNFQISTLDDLLRFDSDKIGFAIEDVFSIDFDNQPIDLRVGPKATEIANLAQVFYLESPSYWKLRDALNGAKDNALRLVSRNFDNSQILTGVPNFFYDLQQLLKMKTNPVASGDKVTAIAEPLKAALGGEFQFNDDDLVFKHQASGRAIDKNLISFGMVNLGMIHKLIASGLITAGSFIFIDEPESNLHPDWQVLLTQTLVLLAQHDVNVVVATHSTDILLAIEKSVTKITAPDDLLSVHYFDDDGTLLDLDSEAAIVQLQQVRSELNASYEALYFGA